MWRTEVNLQKPVDPRDWTQVIRLGHWAISTTPRHFFDVLCVSTEITGAFVLIACFFRAKAQIQGTVLAKQVFYQTVPNHQKVLLLLSHFDTFLIYIRKVW